MKKIENEKEINEIDLSFIFDFLKRNKFGIGLGSILLFIFSAVISFYIPKTWEGGFQIVLQNKNINKNKPQLNKAIGSFISDVNTQTQIGILKSPSVLMPIFEFVKSEKAKKGIETEDWVFKNWSTSQLNVGLEKGTKILNLSYRDKNKDIIIPTLDLISNTYQSYTTIENKKYARAGIKYLDEQIKDYQQKNKISQRKLVEHSMKNDLQLPEILEDKINPANELDRSILVSKLRLIDQQMISLKEFSDPNETLKFISLTARDLKEEGLIKYIIKIEAKSKNINRRKTFFKEKIIQKEEKLLAKDIINLKRELQKALYAKKIFFENQLASINRSLETLIKQRELALNAKLELKTIEKLQNNRRSLALSETSIQTPWELITNPTLIEKPIKPNKKQFALLGGSIGFILFSIYYYLKELKSDLIFEKKTFSRISKSELLIDCQKSNDDYIKFFFKNLDKEMNTSINKYGLLFIAEDGFNINEKFNYFISNYLNNKNILIDQTFKNIELFEKIIVITSFGEIKKVRLKEIIKIIEISNKKINGFINI